MTSGQPKRKRGVVLTATGRQKLQNAIQAWEEQDNFGDKLTIEALSDRTKLDAGTVAKVLDGEEGVDRRTLERFFNAFNLELTQDDYGKPLPTSEKISARETRVDWGEAVDVSIFYGRTAELKTLEQWVVSDRCRLIALLGMGGIGKTSLAAKLGEQVQGEFDYVVWRSLREAPPLKEILTSLIQFLSNQQETEADLPESLGRRITKLVAYLRSHRCLLILDNAESILQEGQAGVYREGYEGYGELLKRVGESSHQSCLLVTSREKPRELSAMEGEAFLVRSLPLRGVEDADGQAILSAKGLHLSQTNDQRDELIHRCAGNPLALKLVATTIQELFDGDIAEFLSQETIAFEGVRDLLDQHFNRLSELEQSVMYWLAINREPVSVQELQEDIVPTVAKPKLLEALRGLVGRSLIEGVKGSYTQQPVVMEYITEHLIERVCKEIETGQISLFNDYSLTKASSKEYVREVQIRLMLVPIIERATTVFENQKGFEERLKHMIEVRKQSALRPGYLGGNILNLLCQQNLNLSGYDFSDMTIWQAFLRDKPLQYTNFMSANFNKSIFTQNFGSATAVAFHPNGELLATVDTTSGIRLWRLRDTQQISIFHGHTNWVLSINFAPNGEHLVSGGADGTVRLWNVSTSQCTYTFQGHSDQVVSVSFNSNGQVLASGSADRTVRIWDANTGKHTQTLQGHRGGVSSIAFIPDTHMIASGSVDGTIKIWDFHSGRCLHTLQDHTDAVVSVAVNFNGRILASGSSDRTIKIWNLASFQCVQTLQGHIERIYSVAFNPKNQTLASAGVDRTIKIWDFPNNRCFQTLYGHNSTIRSIVFDLNGSILASCGDDQTVRLWNTEIYQCIHTLRGCVNRIWSVSFSVDGQLFASSSDDQLVRIWDIKSFECIQTLQGHTHWVESVVFSPTNQIIATASSDESIKIWDIEKRRCLHTLRGHNHRIHAVAFKFDGQILASGGQDRTVRIWETMTYQCLHVLKGHSNWVIEVAFSSDGKLLATASSDWTVRIWETTTYQCLHILQDHTGSASSVAFSPDGKLLATASSDWTVRIWETTTYQCLHILQDHTGSASSVAFSPDGKLLATSGADQTVRLWDTDNFKCCRILRGHTNWVWSATFNPDASVLVSTSEDGTIRLWDVKTFQCLAVLRAPRPYEGMNITSVTGLTDGQKATLIALGAFELE